MKRNSETTVKHPPSLIRIWFCALALPSCFGEVETDDVDLDRPSVTERGGESSGALNLMAQAKLGRVTEAEASAIVHYLKQASSDSERARILAKPVFIVVHGAGLDLSGLINRGVEVVLAPRDGVELAIDQATRSGSSVFRVIMIDRSCEMYVGHYEISIIESTYVLRCGIRQSSGSSVRVFCLIRRGDRDWNIELVGGGVS